MVPSRISSTEVGPTQPGSSERCDLALHPVGFAWPFPSPETPVRSYRTLSPLTAAEAVAGLLSVARAVALRLPENAFPLGSTVPCGVRTFLIPKARDATVRPARVAAGARTSTGCSQGCLVRRPPIRAYTSMLSIMSSYCSLSTMMRPVCSQTMMRLRCRISTWRCGGTAKPAAAPRLRGTTARPSRSRSRSR